MAIDTLAKRASVASIGLAFLGPSIIPSGTIGAAERQVISNSYYGILADSGSVSIGGTSQLENYTSTGGITLERVLGSTSQIEPYTSTGGITLERAIGGTSQLGPFGSSGGIQVGEEATAKGGYIPPTFIDSKLKKKDESVLEQVFELVAKTEEVHVPEKIIKQVKAVEKQARNAITIKPARQHNVQLKQTQIKITKLQSILDTHIKEARDDEEAAIKALLEVI